MMNKRCKNHNLLLVTELIFYNNPKASGNNPIGFLPREPGWCKLLGWPIKTQHNCCILGWHGQQLSINWTQSLKKAYGTTMWTQTVTCTDGLWFLHLYCCSKPALYKSGAGRTRSWSQWGWRCGWTGCTWLWSPCRPGHCRGLAPSVQNNLESLLVLRDT